MTRFTFIPLLIATILTLASCKNDDYIKAIDNTKFELKVGDAVMLVDASDGAKVVSLKLGEKEILAQHVEPANGRFGNRFDYGSTFWPSPQEPWYWPPIKTYDYDNYLTELTEKKLTATSGINERYPYRFIKEYSIDSRKQAFVITYTIENPNDSTISVAPWEITRVPNAGVFFFDAKKADISPNDLIPTKYDFNYAWCEFSSATEQRKIFVDPKGWLAYSNNGFLLLKQFDDLHQGEAAPGESEMEVYIADGELFIELENQGAYATLQPGEKLTYTVRWYVRPTESAPIASKQLSDEVSKLFKQRQLHTI